MADGSEVKWVGDEAALADMRRWADQLPGVITKAGDPFAQRLADVVAGKVPVLTGQLAGSVEATSDDEGIGVTMGDGIPYAGWIEFGGGRGRPYIDAGRYLYPTALEAQDEFAQMAADAAAESVGRFSWSTPST